MDVVADKNIMTLFFANPADVKHCETTKSYNLIYTLVNHKGEGSLYECLKQLHYITRINFCTNQNEIVTPFLLIGLQLTLTKDGAKNYKKVLAIILEFFRVVREKWLAND